MIPDPPYIAMPRSKRGMAIHLHTGHGLDRPKGMTFAELAAIHDACHATHPSHTHSTGEIYIDPGALAREIARLRENPVPSHELPRRTVSSEDAPYVEGMTGNLRNRRYE